MESSRKKTKEEAGQHQYEIVAAARMRPAGTNSIYQPNPLPAAFPRQVQNYSHAHSEDSGLMGMLTGSVTSESPRH